MITENSLLNTRLPNSLLNMFAKCGMIPQAEDLFAILNRLNIADKTSWNTIISAYSDNMEGEKAVKVRVAVVDSLVLHLIEVVIKPCCLFYLKYLS